MPLAVIAIAIAVGLLHAQEAQNDPVQKESWVFSPYTRAVDSPFAQLPFAYFHLEDFEEGALKVPGVSLTRGALVIGERGYATHLVDSVDGDDGRVDGSGSAGHSLWSGKANGSLVFVFDGSVLDGLPTHAGLVWTDSRGPVRFSLTAFDAAGKAVAKVGPLALGDGVIVGTTAEDHFLGLHYPGGIARLHCDNLTVDFEVDHLQYGRISPCRECGPAGLTAP